MSVLLPLISHQNVLKITLPRSCFCAGIVTSSAGSTGKPKCGGGELVYLLHRGHYIVNYIRYLGEIELNI